MSWDEYRPVAHVGDGDEVAVPFGGCILVPDLADLLD